MDATGAGSENAGIRQLKNRALRMAVRKRRLAAAVCVALTANICAGRDAQKPNIVFVMLEYVFLARCCVHDLVAS